MKKKFAIAFLVGLLISPYLKAQVSIQTATVSPGYTTNSVSPTDVKVGNGAGASSTNLTSSNSVYIGSRCGVNLVNSTNNTLLGADAGRSFSSGISLIQNTILGSQAARNISGNENTYVGFSAGFIGTTPTNPGSRHTFIGNEAGREISGGLLCSGIGYRCGTNFRFGESNTFLGANTSTTLAAATSLSFGTAVGSNTILAHPNTVIIGAPAAVNTTNFVNGVVRVGIGTNNPSEQLHTNGGVRFEGVGAQNENTNNTQWLTIASTGEVGWRNLPVFPGGVSALCGTTTIRNFPFWTTTTGDLSCSSPIFIDNLLPNIGIGETAPQNRLHVRNGAGTLGTFYNNYINPDLSTGIAPGSFSVVGTSSHGTNNSTNIGVSGYTTDDNSNNYGAYYMAFGDKTTYNPSNPIQPGNLGSFGYANGDGLPGTAPLNPEWIYNFGAAGRGEGCNAYNFGGIFVAVAPPSCCDNGFFAQTIGVQGEAQNGSRNYGVRGLVFDYNNQPGCILENLAGYFGGDVVGSSFTTPSDEKLKTNIKTFEGALGQLNKLHVKTYDFKKEEYKILMLPKENQIGLMAQDLKKVFPSLVRNTYSPTTQTPDGKIVESINYETVNYTGLVPVLIQAVKELDTKTEEIKTLKIQLEEQGRLIEELCNGGCETQLQKKGNITGTNSNNYIKQNRPNPFSSSTVIDYFITDNTSRAEIQVYNLQGMLLKGFSIENKGQGSVSIAANEFAPGTYTYSLIVDGTTIDTKIMVITK
jgi:hypothetical protein